MCLILAPKAIAGPSKTSFANVTGEYCVYRRVCCSATDFFCGVYGCWPKVMTMADRGAGVLSVARALNQSHHVVENRVHKAYRRVKRRHGR